MMAAGTEYLSCADTARHLRQALRRTFSGVKFRVRSDTSVDNFLLDPFGTVTESNRIVEVGALRPSVHQGNVHRRRDTEIRILTAALERNVQFGGRWIVSHGFQSARDGLNHRHGPSL